jgi:hypothetical protein
MIDSSFHIKRRKAGLRRRLPVCWAAGLALLVSMGWASASWALHAAPERLSSLAVQGLRWEPMQSMSLSGVPAHLKPFVSDNAAVSVALSLSTHSDLFQRVLTTPGTIVLSGLQADWHWLAQVDTLAKGAKGYVSAMRVAPALASAGPAGAEPGFPWLPRQAQRRFAYRSNMTSPIVSQHVYSIALPIQALTAYVRRQLRAEGWKAEPAIAGASAYSAWHRQTSRLMLFAQAGSVGTDLYVHYIE